MPLGAAGTGDEPMVANTAKEMAEAQPGTTGNDAVVSAPAESRPIGRGKQ